MKNCLLMAMLVALAITGSPAAAVENANSDESNSPSCSLVYKGDHSTVEICDPPSISITRENPQDMVRIDKPFAPGPNAIVREVPEKVFEKPKRWIKKTFGL